MNYLFIIIFTFIIFYILNKLINYNENFQLVTTWTPYILDVYNQPGYTNYFYKNAYMYPVY